MITPELRFLNRPIGRPSTKDFIRLVEDNFLTNCPVTKMDMGAEHFFAQHWIIIRKTT